MKTYRKYSDIPKQYRFDLDFLLEGRTIEDKLAGMDEYISQLIAKKIVNLIQLIIFSLSKAFRRIRNL